MIRLDKFLSDATAYSRKDVRLLVKRGTITVNGAVAKNTDMKVSEDFYRDYIVMTKG